MAAIAILPCLDQIGPRPPHRPTVAGPAGTAFGQEPPRPHYREPRKGAGNDAPHGGAGAGGPADETGDVPPPRPGGPESTMEYGPFLSSSVYRPRVSPAKPATTKPAAAGTAPAGRAAVPPGPAPTVEARAETPAVAAAPSPRTATTASAATVATTGPATAESPAARSRAELICAKGVTIKVARDVSVCYDTDLLRVYAGWTGGFLDLSRTNLGSFRGREPAAIQGQTHFMTRPVPGWAKGDDFSDPRPANQGPLPKDWAHYRGLYRCGDKIVLSYSVGAAGVLELPGAAPVKGLTAFTRTIRAEACDVPRRVLICETREGASVTPGRALTLAANDRPEGSVVSAVGGTLESGRFATQVVAVAPAGAALEAAGGNISLKLPASSTPVTFKIVLCAGAKSELASLQELLNATAAMEDLPALCKGGPSLWKEPIVTSGERSPDGAAYVVDTVKLPEQNPWNAWMRPGGHDFFADGRLALCTLNGDVWVASGLDASLQNVTWKRFATGLYEPLGLRVVDGLIYVLGRDQITRLHDLDGDGEADFYENFNNDAVASPIYHAFAFDLQTDSRGDFYYVRDGNQVPLSTPGQGCLYKVSKDGARSEIIATGFRAPNGMAVGPGDQIAVGDNQGHWTPSSKINLIDPLKPGSLGGFYGFVGDPRRLSKAEMDKIETAQRQKYPHLGYEPPLCWIPYGWDNSSGGQVWAPPDEKNWGPLAGHLLHTSYGKSTLFEVMSETVDGQAQGGVVQLPLRFDSGVMRGRFSPADGQLYLSGLKGWQTNAGRDGCLQRVRYTGKPFNLPVALHATSAGLYVTFGAPLDPLTAGSVSSYNVENFVYHWSSTYGSAEYRPSDPETRGHDTLPIDSATVSADRRTVCLGVRGLEPVMQMVIQMNIRAADGSAIRCAIGNTINAVGPDKAPGH